MTKKRRNEPIQDHSWHCNECSVWNYVGLTLASEVFRNLAVANAAAKEPGAGSSFEPVPTRGPGGGGGGGGALQGGAGGGGIPPPVEAGIGGGAGGVAGGLGSGGGAGGCPPGGVGAGGAEDVRW